MSFGLCQELLRQAEHRLLCLHHDLCDVCANGVVKVQVLVLGTRTDWRRLDRASAGHSWNQSMVQQFTKLGKLRNRFLKAEPMGDMQMTMCKFLRHCSTYHPKISAGGVLSHGVCTLAALFCDLKPVLVGIQVWHFTSVQNG